MSVKNSVRSTTEKWLKQKAFTIIFYWGDDKPSLWEALDLYAQAESESESGMDAIAEEFPDTWEDFEIKRVDDDEFYPLIDRETYQRLENCKHKMIFFGDSEISWES